MCGRLYLCFFWRATATAKKLNLISNRELGPPLKTSAVALSLSPSIFLVTFECFMFSDKFDSREVVSELYIFYVFHKSIIETR